MQNQFVGDIGDYFKFGILRALMPGYRLGVAWWLSSDDAEKGHGQQIGYLRQPGQWRHFDPVLFDFLDEIVTQGRRSVTALQSERILPGVCFADTPIPRSVEARAYWLSATRTALGGADVVFVDPDNGLEPDSHRPGSAVAGKSVTFHELTTLSNPRRCLIVYHHHTRRKGGHHQEIDHWAARLRTAGFGTIDALRARSGSPRVFFLLDAPPVVRKRGAQIAEDWAGLITWHPDAGLGDEPVQAGPSTRQADTGTEPKVGRPSAGRTTQVGFVNRNSQEVIRPTGRPGSDHMQLVYVLRCHACGHEYGANGSDIWLRKCPGHAGGAPGLPI